MIEHFYEHPYTLRYLRSGVTGPHIDAFAAFLVNRGYAWNAGRSLLRGVGHLGHWLQAKDLGLADLDESVLVEFKGHLSNCRCVRQNKGRLEYCRSAANHFLAWARSLGLVPAAAPENPVPPLIQEFETWMIQHRNVALATLSDCYRLQLRRLLDSVGDDPSTYDAAGIRRFVLVQSRRTGPSRAKQAVTAARMLLRFLSLMGRCAPELVDAVPTIAHWRLGALPRCLPAEVVAGIEASCDLQTAVGRRDRAVLLLMTRLGLRAGDVAGLRLDDVDWDEATITVFGKGRREARLPLPQEVGDATLAWLTNGRAIREDDHLFLLARAPWGPLHRASVGGIAARAGERVAKQMGLDLPHVGTHVLRHAAAKSMLDEGMSLQAIGAVLRHRSQETTAIYAKVDQGLLDTVVRPWPKEVSP